MCCNHCDNCRVKNSSAPKYVAPPSIIIEGPSDSADTGFVFKIFWRVVVALIFTFLIFAINKFKNG